MTAPPADERICVIGAGCAGLAAAKELGEQGIRFDVLERSDDIGGLWRGGVYDSTHLISSRGGTGFLDFPMPADYPDFPSAEQMLSYIDAYAKRFQLRRNIRFGSDVVEAVPLSPDGTDGWMVRCADGFEQRYTAVVAATGHHWKERHTAYPGRFTGKMLHSHRYRRPADLDGTRVVVVGAGTSGCDLAVEAANAGFETYLSMRRGYWFVPKLLFGLPSAELDVVRLPQWMVRRSMKVMLALRFGPYESYGLPRPDHDLFDRHPVVNEQLMYHLRHGSVSVRPDVAAFDGGRVRFVDGTSVEADTVLEATGYDVAYPYLGDGSLDWETGAPLRVAAGHLAARVAGLYFLGLYNPRGGGPPLYSRSGRLIATAIAAQRRVNHPLAWDFARFARPTSRMLWGFTELAGAQGLATRLARLFGWIGGLPGTRAPDDTAGTPPAGEGQARIRLVGADTQRRAA